MKRWLPLWTKFRSDIQANAQTPRNPSTCGAGLSAFCRGPSVADYTHLWCMHPAACVSDISKMPAI